MSINCGPSSESKKFRSAQSEFEEPEESHICLRKVVSLGKDEIYIQI